MGRVGVIERICPETPSPRVGELLSEFLPGKPQPFGRAMLVNQLQVAEN
jgi:hypothetical protein